MVERSDVPAWLRGMNQEQTSVIMHDEGPLAVPAMAGAGKTRALVHRIARLVEEKRVEPSRILAVTFSRKAADEMDSRLRQLGVGAVSVQTWHALCYRMLREDATPYGTWTLDDKDRAKLHVKLAIGYKHLNWKGADLTRLRRFIGVCKANLLFPGDEATLEEARKFFAGQAEMAVRAYDLSQQLIENARLLTFDDMLVYAWRHLSDEFNRKNWANKFDYVHCDETQDNSAIQEALAEMLSRDRRNYMIVFDPAQAIYSFRGSSPKYVMEFEQKWPGANRIAMNRNYRSGDRIVEFANAIIAPAAVRLPEEMTAERGVEGRVDIVSCDTLEDEAQEFVEHCTRLRDAGEPLSNVTCLFRLNAQSRALEEGLLKAKLPYVIVGGTNFYERKEVKDLLGYLRVVAGRDRDGDGLKRCINAPFRFLGAKFVERVMEIAAGRQNPDWIDVVRQAATGAGIQRRQVESAEQWATLMGQIATDVADLAESQSPAPSDFVTQTDDHPMNASTILDALVRRTGYLAWLEKEEGEESIESSHAANVREMIRVATQFGTVDALLDYIDEQVKASERQRRAGKGGDRVTLMSVHRSKGLEFPTVWVAGCNEGVLPHAKGDIEEERRIMYVAATRARDHLICSYVGEMALRTGVKSMTRSRFLAASDALAEKWATIDRVEDPNPPEPMTSDTDEQIDLFGEGGAS